MQRGILQELRGAPFDPGVRRFCEPCVELLDQAGLAETGFADDQHKLAFTNPSALPPTGEQTEFLLPADKRRQGPPAAPSAAAACANYTKKLNRLGNAFEFVLAALLGDEKSCHLPLNVHGDEDRARFGGGLDARGYVRCFAKHLPGRLHDNGTGLEPNAGQELGRTGIRVAGVEFAKRALDGERRAHGALGIVLLRTWVTKERHQTVAELLEHMAAKIVHRRRSLVEIGVDEVAPILRVELRGQGSSNRQDRRTSL